MNRKILSCILLTFFGMGSLLAQRINGKKVVDIETCKKWPLGLVSRSEKISDDGKFLSYAYQLQDSTVKTIVRKIDGTFEKEIAGIPEVHFTRNSRLLILTNNDDLSIINLNDLREEKLQNITSFALTEVSSTDYLVFKSNNSSLCIRNLFTNKQTRLAEVLEFWLSPHANSIIYSTNNGIYQFNITTLQSNKIGRSSNVINLTSDKSGKRIAYISQTNEINPVYKLVYWNKNDKQSITQIEIPSGFSLLPTEIRFQDGKLYFRVSKNKVRTPRVHIDLNIWHYKDVVLNSEQEASPFQKELRAILGDDHIVHLFEAAEDSDVTSLCPDFLVVSKKKFHDSLPFDTIQKDVFDIIDTKLGTRKKLVEISDKGLLSPALSPKGKYLVWYNAFKHVYYSYCKSSGVTTNICKNLPFSLSSEYVNREYGMAMPFGIAAWSPDGSEVYVYDEYDIWKVDLSGVRNPENVTNGYGRREKIILSLLHSGGISSLEKETILAGYSAVNKCNGFFKWVKGTTPELRTMDPYCYFMPRLSMIPAERYPTGFEPIKAKNANVYLVERMSAENDRNLFTTTDFITFKQISEIQRPANYNWLTTELITWDNGYGNLAQGILYKPENFDPRKKYPIIFNYYARLSDAGRDIDVIHPQLSRHNINISYYVSNGYLVFQPDIYYRASDGAGLGALKTLESAAKFLIKQGNVDSTRMGIQGHSFGGYQTNFIITHSKLFAAACEAAGVSDHISSYGQLTGYFGTHQRDWRGRFHEGGAQAPGYGIGVTPWTHPDIYMENSPVLKIGEITTPLLMMHCKKDPAVPFEQAVELFTGMRRAGKRVWMLEYDKGEHILNDDFEAEDYTIRAKQFFDHYLKNLPPPTWMIQGITKSQKFIECGLAPDLSGNTP